MKRCWLLEPLKDKVVAGDQFVTHDSAGLKLSPFATAMIGLPLPEGWIAFRAMRNRPRRKHGFVATFIRGAVKQFRPARAPDIRETIWP